MIKYEKCGNKSNTVTVIPVCIIIYDGGMDMVKKQICSILLCLVLLLGCFVVVPQRVGAETVVSGDWEYTVLSEEDKTAEIQEYNGEDTEVTIPSTIDGYTVTRIGNYALSECSKLQKISLPYSLKSIGERAFYMCCGLTYIEIPSEVNNIGRWAFLGCSSLTDIIVNSESKYFLSIDGVLYDKACTVLIACGEAKENKVVIPSTVKRIDSYAFYKCKKLISVEIPNGVTSIGECAFSGSGLTNVVLPNSVTSVEKFIFQNCSDLETATISSGMTTIEGQMFMNCVKLAKVVIPNSVKEIGNSVFMGCNNLKDVQIPDSVQSIGYSAFRDCSSLENITIPKEVPILAGYVFDGCRGLTSIEIPQGVTSIEYYAFRNCCNLKTVKIPDSVEDIDSSAFFGCTKIESFIVDPTSKYYASVDGVLYNKDISTLILCGQAKTNITIPASVSDISSNAFDECKMLETIDVDSASEYYKSVDGVLYDIDIRELIACGGAKKSIIIPASVIKVSSYKLFECSSLETIDVDPFSKYYRSIDGALYSKDGTTLIGCGGARKSIIISPRVKYICGDDSEDPEIYFLVNGEDFVIYGIAGSYAETYSKKYKIKFQAVDKIEIPTIEYPTTEEPTTEATTTEESSTEEATTTEAPTTEEPTTDVPATSPAKKGMVLENTKAKCKVKVVSDNAKSPTVSYIGTTNKKATSVKVPGSVTIDGVTYKVVSISGKAFKNNKKLKKVTIDKNITSIGSSAFEGCTSLTTVTINATSLNKIGSNAFKGDKNLKKITIKATKLAKNPIGQNVLKGTHKKLVIKVPKQKLNTYKKYFKNKGNNSVTVKK